MTMANKFLKKQGRIIRIIEKEKTLLNKWDHKFWHYDYPSLPFKYRDKSRYWKQKALFEILTIIALKKLLLWEA